MEYNGVLGEDMGQKSLYFLQALIPLLERIRMSKII